MREAPALAASRTLERAWERLTDLSAPRDGWISLVTEKDGGMASTGG